MGYRTVSSPDGREWEVWDTVPTQDRGLIRPAFAGGWLTFQTRGEKRRLAPIPDGWESASGDELSGWLAQADPADPAPDAAA
jgi:hypothetical protein